MPGARRRRYSGRHRAHDELFGPTAGRSNAPAGSPSGGGGEPRPPAEAAAADPPALGDQTAVRLMRLAGEADADGRLDEAIEQYQRVLATNPLHVEARIALVRVFERAERPDLALALLDEGVTRQPDSTEVLLARGRALGQQRRYPEAEADLRRVLRLHPSHGPAHFELGLILVRRGRAPDAADAFARAVAFGPESAHTYTELAEALNQSGRLTDAAAALERAVALDPDQPRPYKLMGRVLDRLLRSDEATLMYRRARELAAR